MRTKPAHVIISSGFAQHRVLSAISKVSKALQEAHAAAVDAGHGDIAAVMRESQVSVAGCISKVIAPHEMPAEEMAS